MDNSKSLYGLVKGGFVEIDKKNEMKHQFVDKINKEMKPIYSTDNSLSCGLIEHGNKTYYFDFNDRDKIINYKKKFVFDSVYDIYPSFKYNNSKVSYL